MIKTENTYFLRFKIISLFFMLLGGFTFAQVKVGEHHKDINPGSLLELESQNKGLVFPRIALNDSLYVWGLDGNLPLDGMVVYNTNDNINSLGLYCWYNEQWNYVGGGSGGSEADSLYYDHEKLILHDDGDSTVISSGRVCMCASVDVLQSYLDAATTTEGDIYYITGNGIFIRNNIADATTVGEAYIFMSAVVTKGAILCASSFDDDDFNINVKSKSTILDGFMVAEQGLYQKPDTAVIVPVEDPSINGGYYSFAIPNDWDNPIISLKVANSGGGFFRLENCWNVEHNMQRGDQLYQVWTLDVPLKQEIMAKPFEFKIE